jgi:hypothetical protein
MRPARTLGATLLLVLAFGAFWYAYQDLRGYWGAVSAGYTEWAFHTAQGWWKLTSGAIEAAAFVTLLTLAVRLLGPKFAHALDQPTIEGA